MATSAVLPSNTATLFAHSTPANTTVDGEVDGGRTVPIHTIRYVVRMLPLSPHLSDRLTLTQTRPARPLLLLSTPQLNASPPSHCIPLRSTVCDSTWGQQSVLSLLFAQPRLSPAMSCSSWPASDPVSSRELHQRIGDCHDLTCQHAAAHRWPQAEVCHAAA